MTPPQDAVHLSPTQRSRLSMYASLLRDRAIPLGLIAASDRDALWERHLEDSLRAAALFDEGDRRSFDIGSGAGLPGVVLAIALPDRDFLLIESQRRRVGFLELAVERLRLGNVEVVAARAEEVGEEIRSGRRDAADLVTARAFAPIERSWEVARPLLAPEGRLVYFAGAGLADPEGAARRAGAARVDVIPLLESATPLVIMARQ